MSTTSLKLPDDLKVRAISAARSKGVTTHAFMLDAIRMATSAAEKRASFIADAMAADAQMRKTRKGYDAAEVRAYLKALVAGKKPRKPRAKTWRS
jgi:predicted transcriptional regulator of viral defense system